MGGSEVGIRPYRPSDRDAVTALSARAFQDDPGWQYVFGERVQDGLAWITPRLHDLRVEAGATVAVAERAGRPVGVAYSGVSDHFGLTAQIRHGLLLLPLRFGLPTLRRVRTADLALEALRTAVAPPPPTLYGVHLAVDPDHQRQGIGPMLLRTWSERAQAEGGSVHLLTTRADNVRFYERNGYRILAQDGIAHAFTCWAMAAGG